MRYSFGKRVRGAALALICGASTLTIPGKALAQATDPTPQWMKDSVAVENRYLVLWEYYTGANVTKFDVWTNEGNPEDARDNFAIFEDPDPAVFSYIVPWGTRVLSAPHPPYSNASPDTSPYANIVTVRVDDPDSDTGFTDLAYPGDGTPFFGPPTPSLPRQQGFFAPYRFEDGAIEVEQKIEFARDLVRIEYTVRNVGAGARRVGIRLLVDPYIDYWGPNRSMFLPDTRERVFFEKDYGQRTGSPVIPKDPRMPETWEHYDDDEGPDPIFIAKGILTGNGATTPTRMVFANSLNLFPNEGTWDYDVDRPQELRISDKSVLIYWDPVDVAAGQVKSFVTYAGVGVASHVMSNAYLAGQERSARTRDYATQGYIGAVQTPFAMPIVGSNADIDTVGNPLTAKVTAYMQNEYQQSSIPGASVFIDVPDGLQLVGGASRSINLGRLDALNSTGIDERSGTWQLQATGLEAGLLPVGITYSNGFQDSKRHTRVINVPQGRRYQLGDDWRMFTFPFNYTGGDDDPVSVLGLPAGTFQIVQYNPANGRYEPVTRLQPGRSYWIRILGQGDTFIRAANARAVTLPLSDKYVVRVLRGWNQVGNPSPYSVSVRNLKLLFEGGVHLSFADAVSRGLIRSSLYTYNRKRNIYEQLTVNSQIPPGTGVWIYSTREQSILWPAPEGPELSISQ
jgi:hypothetical protein